MKLCGVFGSPPLTSSKRRHFLDAAYVSDVQPEEPPRAARPHAARPAACGVVSCASGLAVDRLDSSVL